MSHKRKWRKRTSGTPNQIGKAFPIDEPSQQKLKASLPRISESREDRLAKIHRRMAEYEAEKEDEAEKKEHHGLTDRIKKAVKPKEKPTTEQKMIGGLPARVPVTEEVTPVQEIRIEVMPVMETVKSYGEDVRDWFKTTRVFLYLQRKADERVLKKEQEKASK